MIRVGEREGGRIGMWCCDCCVDGFTDLSCSLDESGMFSTAGTNAHGAESSEAESALSQGDDEFMRRLLEGSPSPLA